jgi:hypothetical protein
MMDGRRRLADRPAGAGWAALRLLAGVASSIERNCCSQSRGDDGALAVTDHDDVGIARKVRSAPSAASYRAIDKRWQILQRSHSTPSTLIAVLTRARESERRQAGGVPDRPARPAGAGWAALRLLAAFSF